MAATTSRTLLRPQAARSKTENLVKLPEIYSYHDHLEFLRDWLAYRKASQPGFSTRSLARDAGLSPGYLPLVLAGKRVLSHKALTRLGPHLGLSKNERSYLDALVTLGTTDSQPARLEALEKMKRFGAYQRSNPRELETYRYLTHWYYVAIREMALLPDFEPTPEWIQPRLRETVPAGEIQAAVEFLLSNGFLAKSVDGRFSIPERALECVGGVYKVALTQFHHEVLDLAARSIMDTPSTDRTILGHTVALGERQFEEARSILDEAIRKIRELGQKADATSPGEAVYHAELLLFPMTRKAPGRRRTS
jgi:uncharacterized protein (TIGR02147 family)